MKEIWTSQIERINWIQFSWTNFLICCSEYGTSTNLLYIIKWDIRGTNEALIGINNKVFKNFSIKLILCMIRMLLSNIRIVKDNTKVETQTKVPIFIIYKLLTRMNKMSLNTYLLLEITNTDPFNLKYYISMKGIVFT